MLSRVKQIGARDSSFCTQSLAGLSDWLLFVMESIIPDTNTEARMASLEHFLERYLGPRLPEFGASENDLDSIEMPGPLQRFFKFAGRWPGHNPRTPYANRFCMQDMLCAIRKNEHAPTPQLMDNLLVFVWENQGVWVAATERAGDDPPVWISENCSHRNEVKEWKQLENPLSHFLVSFVLQELMFGSEIVGVAPGALAIFKQAGVTIEPVWMNGEYVWDIDRPSYFLADESFLLRRAPNEADGDEWYGCNTSTGAERLTSLGLPTQIP
jgi:hypothetical protein